MNFSSDVYDKVCSLQENGARNLIHRILNENPGRAMDIIVDVGCGSGSITNLLAKSIRHKKVLGIDSNHKMVEFSTDNYMNQKTKFCVGDISSDWETLAKDIRELEGRVDLVFSNYALHWVDKHLVHKACENMHRLLKPEGLCYFNIVILKPVFEYMPPNSKDLFKNFFNGTSANFCTVPEWVQRFKSVGFTNVEGEFKSVVRNCATSEEYIQMMKLIMGLYTRFFPSDNEVELNSELGGLQKMKKELEYFLLKSHAVEIRTPIKEIDEEKEFKIYHEICEGKAQKFNLKIG